MKKPLSCALLITLLVSASILVFATSFGVVQASTEVTGIIGSDVTWTKAGGPYSLTGNLLVGNGATLTIEAGVVVNLNGYYIMVNGTLRAHGTETEQIQFNGNKITFTQHSSNWDEQTGSGSIIENANLESTEVDINSASPKINSNSISKIAVGGSTILTNNVINQELTGYGVADSPVISGNTLLQGGVLTVSGSAVVSSNVIEGNLQLQEGSATVSNNNVSGMLSVTGSAVVSNNVVSVSLYVGGTAVASNNTATSAGAGGSATLSDNTILGKVSITKSDFVTISNNIINGGISLGGTDHVNASIINNTITGGDFGYGIRIAPTSYIFLISAGRTDAYISGNTIFDCTTAGIEVGGVGAAPAGGPYLRNVAVIEGNTVVNAGRGIDASSNETIRNNIVAYNEIGIMDGELTEGNLIVNNTYGIKGGNVIQNNTIVNNSVGVEGGFTTLVYNNIYDNFEYNVRLNTPVSPNAAHNWWGTTDPQAINQTIYDYKNDFYLSTLNFAPFLTEPNPEAPSTQTTIIPEFPSWLLLPLFLVATFAVVAVRRRLVC